MSGPGPYRQWPPPGNNARWLHAANLFGQHLMKWAAAWEQIPDSAPAEVKALARQTALDTLHAVMAILEGVPSLETEDGYRVEYVLMARIQERQGSSGWTTVETFELAPGGDDLRLGLAGWAAGKFGDDDSAASSSGSHKAAPISHQQARRESLARRTAGGPPCPHCRKPLRSAKARQCFHCGRSWHENPPVES